jgi:RNA polymerase sigma-70 factor, ECF subfamily
MIGLPLDAPLPGVPGPAPAVLLGTPVPAPVALPEVPGPAPASRPRVPGPAPAPRSASAEAWLTAAYERHAGELRAYVLARFGGQVAAEDVAQEAFARLVREVTGGRTPDCVRAWLYRVAHNLAVDELRRPLHAESDREVDDERAPAGWTASAEADSDAFDIGPDLGAALGSLSRAARTSILMAADGYSGREIAGAVGRSELATRALLCRTRRTLREALAADGAVARPTAAPSLAA